MERLLSIGQVAERLGVSVDVVRSLDERGELKARRTPGGHRRYAPADVDRVKARLRAARNRTPTRPPRSSTPHRASQSVHRYQPPEIDEDDSELEDVSSVDELRYEAEREAAKERAAAEAKALAAAADAERQRLEALKMYGRDLASWLPAEWQARVIEDLEEFVTSKQVPPSLVPWEAQRIVQSRVDSIKQQYNDLEDQRRKRENDLRRMEWLIAWGNSYAASGTMLGWDSSEQARARREVESELKQKVKADMAEGHVKDLVDDVLNQWNDTDDDHDGDYEDGDEYEETDAEEDDEPEY